jgi:hypothetical protein
MFINFDRLNRLVMFSQQLEEERNVVDERVVD